MRNKRHCTRRGAFGSDFKLHVQKHVCVSQLVFFDMLGVRTAPNHGAQGSWRDSCCQALHCSLHGHEVQAPSFLTEITSSRQQEIAKETAESKMKFEFLSNSKMTGSLCRRSAKVEEANAERQSRWQHDEPNFAFQRAFTCTFSVSQVQPIRTSHCVTRVSASQSALTLFETRSR